MSTRIKINLVVFVGVFLLGLYWAVDNIVTIDAIENPYSITGEFDAASGILPDAEVSYLGVRYGRVGSVELRPGGVTITMKIDKGKELPAGSTFSIFRKSAVGEPYILVTPPDDYTGGGPFVAAGDVIDNAATTTPLEFADMLRSAADLVASLDADVVGGLVSDLSAAIDGRGQDLRQLALDSDVLAASFAGRSETLDRLATNNTRLTRVLADHADDLESSLDSLRQVAASLAASEDDLINTLEVGGETIRRTADIVSAEKRTLDCILGDLETVIDTATIDVRIADLELVVTQGPEAFAANADTFDLDEPAGPRPGAWARVGLLSDQPDPPATQYTPAKTIPPVGEAQPCASGLVPANYGDFVPPAAPDGDILPATGARLVLLAGLVVAVAALAVSRLSRRIPR